MKRLAIITTHPIQYYAPLFMLLAKQEDIELKVFYTWGEAAIHKYDPGFKKSVSWDIPILEGYHYEFLKNTAKQPGSHHRNGIINPDLIKKVKEFNPAAILIYGYAYQSHLKAMRYFKGKIPVWFRGDSNLLDEKNGLKSMLKTLFLKWVYRHVDTAFYVGQNNKAYFKKYGLKEIQLVFAPHAIDNSRFEDDYLSEAKELRTKLGIGEEEILIGYAGKLEPKKDPNILLDAFLNLQLNTLHLLFVGNGDLEEDLKLKVEKLKSENKMSLKVHFMDFQNQSVMPIIYQACDLFSLPSKGPSETWGLAINEAMAAGRAVFASDAVGCAVDLISTRNGAVFKAGNLDDLSEKLRFLVQSREYLNNLGKESKKVISNWSFDNQIQAIKTALSTL